MNHSTRWLRLGLLGIDPSETTFAKRGFWSGRPRAVAQLERAGASFVEGYHAALRSPEPSPLAAALGEIESDWRGFAFEGAGMALALLDRLTPWNRGRLASFLAGPGASHVYMVTIGAGWAWARLGRWLAPAERGRSRLDPVLGWLAFDGYGFHEGYFHPARSIAEQRYPRDITGSAARVFDSGVGRSLWFVCGGDPERLAETIAGFALDRRADLWAGAGLACTYACGVEDEDIELLVGLAGDHRPGLAQGAAFAAKARERAGNPVPHTGRAVSRICGTTPELAGKLCDTELASAAKREIDLASQPVFECWRAGIRQAFQRAFAAEPA